jgi:hypothetical protein
MNGPILKDWQYYGFWALAMLFIYAMHRGWI